MISTFSVVIGLPMVSVMFPVFMTSPRIIAPRGYGIIGLIVRSVRPVITGRITRPAIAVKIPDDVTAAINRRRIIVSFDDIVASIARVACIILLRIAGTSA